MATESPRFVRYVHDELAQEWAKCVDAEVEQSAVRLEAAAMVRTVGDGAATMPPNTNYATCLATVRAQEEETVATIEEIRPLLRVADPLLCVEATVRSLAAAGL